MEAPVPSAGGTLGLTHEITMVRGQGREGVYTEDRSIRVLVRYAMQRPPTEEG